MQHRPAPDRLVIALAQINPTVGDIRGNGTRIRAARAEAATRGADLLVTPELAICGYSPEDLVLKPSFLDAVEREIAALAAETGDGGPAILLGAPRREGKDIHNSALLLDGGAVAAMRDKHELPNYGVFDEKRVFAPGPMPGPINFRGVRIGAMVCEDMWFQDVTECLEESGAEILVVLNGSPFDTAKIDTRLSLSVARVTESGLPLLFVNQIGGQDELVFDGSSYALNADRSLALQLPPWREQLTVSEWERGPDGWVCAPGARAAPADGLETVYQALVLGLRDYVEKNGFPSVLIGLSGGIDSALSAAVAVDALGPARVRCVMMPSPYTSAESLEDAAAIAELLGIDYSTLSIAPAMGAFEEMLRPAFGDAAPDTTEENIQARARGITLMALSNKTGAMVVSTGNKSEMSVGYATLYGDMCGGYAVLKDVYKTMVFALSRWRNAHVPAGGHGPDGLVMPERVITKPPSAELKPDQTDQDTLPPYEELDQILTGLVEDDRGIADLTAKGHDRALVVRIWRMLLTAEYKRRQAPPGVKITSRSFGRDRRYPITNAFRGPD